MNPFHSPLLGLLPFAGLLLSIAVFPLTAARFWEHHLGKIAAGWALLAWLPIAIGHNGPTAFASLLHTALVEYMPFLILVAGLYTVAGGILVKGDLTGTPLRTTVFLAIGAFLASLLGTTGASMVLIRPFLRGLRNRTMRMHSVIFFIFLVSNIGGSLTPIGDPPLFLGFLQGVPFFWTLHTLVPMLLCLVVLLALHYAIDRHHWKKALAKGAIAPGKHLGFGLEGKVNLPLLLGIVGSVIVSGLLSRHTEGLLLIEHHGHDVLLTWVGLGRDLSILLLAGLSLHLTKPEIREANNFSWGPVEEVAKLFAGIFVTLIPVMALLHQGTEGPLGWVLRAVQSPSQYFWATGLLSSFLDNAPTYLLFFEVAGGKETLPHLLTTGAQTLVAISCGAVFMGANSYIGNAPNFLVRNIAEESGVKMPSFFGYLAWSGGILVPLFVVVTFVFF
jgi:Na+/H+ antiporter NhaD/arsenite permease-like protein